MRWLWIWGGGDNAQRQEAKGTHQWVPFSPGSHCLLSAGQAGEQHNGVAGPLRLILMSYYSSPHYPYYWLVWSQPGALGSNNKQSSFFSPSSLFYRLIPLTPTYSERNGADSSFFFFFFGPALSPCIPCTSAHGLSIRAASILLRSWSREVHNHTEWQRLFIPRGWTGFCSKAVIKKTLLVAHNTTTLTALCFIYWKAE